MLSKSCLSKEVILSEAGLEPVTQPSKVGAIIVKQGHDLNKVMVSIPFKKDVTS